MGALAVDIFSNFNARGFNAAAKSIKKFDRQLYKVQRATMQFSAVIAGIGLVAGKMAMSFEDSMGKIVSLVGIGRDEVNAWKKDILKLAPALGKSPKELADAMFFITSAGLRGETALRALEAAGKASAAGLGEVVGIADAVTSAMNAYGHETLSAEKATGILIATIREGKMEAAALTPVIGDILTVASQLHVSFSEVGGAMAAMSRLGANAAKAATALKGVFMALIKPTDKGEEALGKMELSFEKLSAILKEKGLLALLSTLENKFSGNTKELAKIFPRAEGLVGLLGLIGKNMETTTAIMDSLGTAGAKDLEKAFGEASQEAMFKFNQALALIKVTAITLGIELLPQLIPILEKMTNIVKKIVDVFSNLTPAIKKTIINIMAIFAILGPVTWVFSKFVGILVAFLPLLKILRPHLLTLARSLYLVWQTIRVVGVWETLIVLMGTAAAAFGSLAFAAWMWYKDWDRISKGIIIIVEWIHDQTYGKLKDLLKKMGIDLDAFIEKYKSKLETILNIALRISTMGAVGLDTFKKEGIPAPWQGPLLPGPGKKAPRVPGAGAGAGPALSPFAVVAEGKYQEDFSEGTDEMTRTWGDAMEMMKTAALDWGDVFDGTVSGAMAGASSAVHEFFTFTNENFGRLDLLLKDVFQSILDSFLRMVEQMIAEWLILMVLTGGKAKFGMKLLGGFSTGGGVKETGAYLMHKGEFVLPPNVVDAIKTGQRPPMGKIAAPAAAGAGASVQITQNVNIGGAAKENINEIMTKIKDATVAGVRQATELANVQTKAGNKKINEST